MAFTFDEREAYTLESLVQQAIGAASMCWEHVDRAGVFQEGQAREISDALLAKLRAGMPDPDGPLTKPSRWQPLPRVIMDEEMGPDA